MDLEEWELLPDDGFLEIHDDGGKRIFSRKYVTHDPNNIFETDYFTCPSSPKPSLQLIHLPVQLEPTVQKILDHDCTKEVNNPDPDPVTQVFFKKMKENEFVDMKMDSPKSNCNQENEKEVVMKKNNIDVEIKDEETWEENPGGLNIWKWSLNGIGAICSFGVAAATVCIIVFGGKVKNKLHQKQGQKLQFHIFTDDHKSVNQVVQQASRLNEAISAIRGVPITRAHITVGGYYDGF